MKNALIVACVVVTALSILMCEISPSSAIWRIVVHNNNRKLYWFLTTPYK